MKPPLGHRLEMARHAKQLSQQSVARSAGITQKHLSQLENDDHKLLRVSSGTLVKIAMQLDVSTDYLLGLLDVPH